MNKPLTFRKWWAAPIVASVLFVTFGVASPNALAQTQPTEEKKEETQPPPPPPPPAVTAPAPTYPSMGPTRREIMVGPDTYFRFGVFAQAWINYQQTPTKFGTDDGGYSIDMFLRRVRFFTFAQWFKNFNMFILFDSPNLGRGVDAGAVAGSGLANKQFQPTVTSNNIMNDAFVELKLADDQFMIEAGLMVKPFSHNALQSTGNYIQLDISSVAALDAITATQVIRDMGFQLKGYLLEDKLEYRVGAFQGQRQTAPLTAPVSHNAPLIAGRLQYMFFEPEKGYVNSGHTYGRKKMLGIAAGAQWQQGDVPNSDPFIAFSGAVFGALPLSGQADARNGGDEVAFVAEYYRYDSGNVFTTTLAPGVVTPTLPKQNDFLVEAGYYNKDAKLSVFGQFQMRKLDDLGTPVSAIVKTIPALGNTMWFGGGLKYYMAEAAANVTLAYQRIMYNDKVEATTNDVNQITLQLQMTYF